MYPFYNRLLHIYKLYNIIIIILLKFIYNVFFLLKIKNLLVTKNTILDK